ncbi:hypothetical protein K470DRAFT_260634 [Piedraia hortae CBS 480.64]|uniref:HCP-like protein n=1 Tax=Piedraia hortae CBS 480.64 TaxID=1314780 RepID=A0A6A7BQS6_9PEZI|nr:hypothetical protein K470DRAFT_260634 [Piedraia hortae CBS 480.64]
MAYNGRTVHNGPYYPQGAPSQQLNYGYEQRDPSTQPNIQYAGSHDRWQQSEHTQHHDYGMDPAWGHPGQQVPVQGYPNNRGYQQHFPHYEEYYEPNGRYVQDNAYQYSQSVYQRPPQPPVALHQPQPVNFQAASVNRPPIQQLPSAYSEISEAHSVRTNQPRQPEYAAKPSSVAPQLSLPRKQIPEQKQSAMEEWKAREKAKLHADSDTTNAIPQDNAFPHFPTNAKKDRKAQAAERPGTSKSAGRTSGEEARRPQTSPGHKRSDPKPVAPRNVSNDGSNQAQAQHRSNTVSSRLETSHQQRPGTLRNNSGQQLAFRSSPQYNQVSLNAGPKNLSHFQPLAQQPHMQRMPPGPSYAGRNDQNSDTSFPADQPYGNWQPPTQHAAYGRPRTAEDPGVLDDHRYLPQLDIRQGQVHNVQLPLRPSTSHTPRHHTTGSPQPLPGQSRPLQGPNASPVPSKASHQRNQVTAEPGYGYSSSPRTREEEIEAEMPNFDSPPSQAPHRRGQTVDRDLKEMHRPVPPPMPPLPIATGHYQVVRDVNPYSQPAPNINHGVRGNGPDRAENARWQNYPEHYQPAQRHALNQGRGMQPPYHNASEASPMQYQPNYNYQASLPQLQPQPQPQRFHKPPHQVQQPATRARDPLPSTQKPAPRPVKPAPHNPSNPDALPYHPLPESAASKPKPTPVRSYGKTTTQPSASADVSKPVTHEMLERLRSKVSSDPDNAAISLQYAKRLAEASTVLVSDPDPQTAARNRGKYVSEAMKRVKKLVSMGNPDAQFYLAECYGDGALGLDIDSREAFKLYQAAAKQGHPQAAYRTAFCCEMGAEEGGGTSKDLTKALQWYKHAAMLDDGNAQFKLGVVLLKGLLGQKREVGDAIMWLNRAAEKADKTNPHALHELGRVYDPMNVDSVIRSQFPADVRRAREFFEAAAGLEHKQSLLRLGQAYEYGQLDLPVDHRRSIQLYSKAAAKEEHQAELALSGWYLTGAEGILDPNPTEAYLWARKAASSEPPLPKAMFAMAYLCEQGIGCQASTEEARKWYGRAAGGCFKSFRSIVLTACSIQIPKSNGKIRGVEEKWKRKTPTGQWKAHASRSEARRGKLYGNVMVITAALRVHIECQKHSRVFFLRLHATFMCHE